MNNLQKNVQAIQMPEATRRRLMDSVPSKRRRISPAAVAAVLALCLMLPVGAFAAGKAGIFRDVKRWDGAVVGTAYENATDEIDVSASVKDSRILVTVTLLKPEEAPYPYIEELSIGEYQILDTKGKVITEGAAQAVPLTNGQAVFSLPTADAQSLRITEFTANAKAEQPLPIYGNWEWHFG